jgi:hypothetical protein
MLCIFLFFQRLCTPPVVIEKPVITRVSDTTHIVHEGSKVTQPIVYKTEIFPVEKITKELLADTAYMRQLVQAYFNVNHSRDTLKVDTLGYVAADITVSKNNVDSIKWDYKLKEKLITNTITIKEPYKPRNQVYIGGGITATPNLQIQGVEAGLLFKNKKDQIFGGKVQYSPQTGFGVGVSSFWKIKIGN